MLIICAEKKSKNKRLFSQKIFLTVNKYSISIDITCCAYFWNYVLNLYISIDIVQKYQFFLYLF